jgi:AAA+ ATPase superfamily predicted ATPase
MTSQLGFQPPGAFITQLIKSGFRRHGPVTTGEEFEIHNLDLTSLNLDVGVLVPFLLSKRLSGHPIIKSEQIAEVLHDLDKATKSLQRKLAILTIGGKLLELDKSIIDDLRVLNVAVIDRSTIETVCGTDDWKVKAKAISAVLVNYFGRESLTPYVSGRPAIGGRFFGRSSLVSTIVPSQGNYTIIGNRRIGKTSLLKEIRERLKLQGVRTAEIYGATCYNTGDVVYKLLQGLGRYREAEHVLADPNRAKNLASYVHKIPDTENCKVAVFIDELDRILEFDAKQGYEVMHLLRETFEGNSPCRVFLAGFRKVMEIARSLDLPHFNFTTKKELPLFSREETFEMVTNPLERLGIEVTNTDLPAAIYKQTGGHPELIQIHCAAIVRYVQTYNRVPSGTDLLTDVFDNEEYKQKVLGAFLANTNPLEALLCYLLFDNADKGENPTEYEFGPKDVNDVLKNVDIRLGIPKIADIITHLKVSGIIAKVPGASDRYQFSAPQLVNYCVGMELDFCIAETLELVKQSEDAGQILSSEPRTHEDEPLITSF